MVALFWICLQVVFALTRSQDSGEIKIDHKFMADSLTERAATDKIAQNTINMNWQRLPNEVIYKFLTFTSVTQTKTSRTSIKLR